MRNTRFENENSEFEAGEHKLSKRQMRDKAAMLEQTISYKWVTSKEGTSPALETM